MTEPVTAAPPQAASAPVAAPPAPPWGADENFDPQKAWALIEGLRADKEKLSSRPALTDEQQAQLDEYARLVEASKTEQQRQAEELSRWQSDAEKWRTAAVGSRIQALAATEFADPEDAAAALADQAKYLDAGGQINDAVIRADLTALLERKPHWRRADGAAPARVPAPNPAQGSGGAPATDPAAAFEAVLQGQLNGSR